MKTLKKLSAIAIFSFAVLLSSCDPGFDDTYKVKNGLDRDIKLTQGRVYIELDKAVVRVIRLASFL